MDFLRQVFGPSKDEVWQQLSREIGAEYVEQGLLGPSSRVQAHVGEWTITLDTHTVATGHSSITYTRMRAPYVNKDGFRFRIYRQGLFSHLGKLLGTQDVEIGDPAFDEAFIIQGNDEAKLKQLFANPRIRDLIREQPDILLEVNDDEGCFGAQFPAGVDELSFRVAGIIKDPARLRHLYELFAEVLNQLCHMGSAYEDDPHLAL